MCHLNEFPAGEETGHEDINRITATRNDKCFSVHVSVEGKLRDGWRVHDAGTLKQSGRC